MIAKGLKSCQWQGVHGFASDELFLSVEAVKTHLRVLFGKFGVEDLPQNQKRARLVERAFQTGIVNERDL